jgi:hypothetical protein
MSALSQPMIAAPTAGRWRCDHCPADAVVVEPGTEPVHELFLLARGTPTRCWCWTHWLAEFGPCKAAQSAPP